MKVMVTGHRPQRLNNREEEVSNWIYNQLKELKPSIAICGMAAGADQIFAKLALELHIPLAAALPYKKNWDSFHPIVQNMLMRANEIVYACEKYDKNGYYIRDCAMVDAADIVLAVWDGKEWGGTWNTIDYARKKGKKIIYFPWNKEE